MKFILSLLLSLLILSTPSFSSTQDVYDNIRLNTENCDPLPQDQGHTIIELSPANITSKSQFQSIIQNANPQTTFLLEDGTYNVGNILIDSNDITIRSKSGNPDNVIIDGGRNTGWGGMITVRAHRFTLADVTVQNYYYHLVHHNGDADFAVYYNVNFYDAKEQFFKVSSPNGHNSDYGVIACSHFKLTDSGRNFIESEPPVSGARCYTGGIDIHNSQGFMIRDNLIEDIYCTNGHLSAGAILSWNEARDTITKRNIIRDCDRGILYGLGQNPQNKRTYSDDPYPSLDPLGHIDGEIINNVISASDSVRQYYDSAISVEQAHGVKIYHNTAATQPTFVSMAYRYSDTDADIKNNIFYSIMQRNGASGDVSDNVVSTSLQSNYFEDYDDGDFTLSSQATSAIDQGTTSLGVAIDLERNSRDSSPDIGAYEFNATPSQEDPPQTNTSNPDPEDTPDDNDDNDTPNDSDSPETDTSEFESTDVNEDGQITQADMVDVVMGILSKNYEEKLDVNSDGVLNLVDVFLILEELNG